MRRSLLVLLVGALSCRGESPFPRGPAAAPLERPYRPPADGRLTERQVQAFVAALRARPSGTARGKGESEGDVESFDGRKGSEEYLWVRQRVFESEIRIDESEADRREVEIDRRTAGSLRKASGASNDPATRASLERQAADLDRRAGELERAIRSHPPPDQAANDGLVGRYRRVIDAAERGAAPR